MKRTLIRALGCLTSVVSVLVGARAAQAAQTATVVGNYNNTVKNINIRMEGAAHTEWGCIPLKNGKAKGGQITCSSTDVSLTEYVDNSYAGTLEDGWLGCSGAKAGVGGNPSTFSWACYCNKDMLCAPTSYLQRKWQFIANNSAPGSGGYYAYNSAVYYTPAMWATGITESGTTGAWGGAYNATTSYGSVTVNTPGSSGSDGYRLSYPVELVNVCPDSCMDGGYYLDTTGISGTGCIAITLTEFMVGNTATYGDMYIANLINMATPSYSDLGAQGPNATWGNGRSWVCTACGTDYPTRTDASFVSGRSYTDGYDAYATVTYENERGTFNQTGCECRVYNVVLPSGGSISGVVSTGTIVGG